MNTMRKETGSIDVIKFSEGNIEARQIAAYIKRLYKEKDFSHIGYHFEEDGRQWVIHTRPNQEEVIKYFREQSSESIINSIQKENPKSMAANHTIAIYIDNFSEFISYIK